MAYDLVDFSDLVAFVREELRIQSTDTDSINRIKRDINACYINEVVPYKRWNWLSGHTAVQQLGYYNTGTCSVTPDSTTVTLSIAPSLASGSRAGYLFSVDGYDEIYPISAHTAASTTITLSSKYTGSLNTTATFKIWNDSIALPADCRETIEVWHDFHRGTMEALGLQEFRRQVRENPKLADKPVYYTTYDYTGSTEDTRYRSLKVYPSLFEDTITVHVDYVKDVTALDADGDEPEIPIGDRIVLAYGALYRAWSRERNPEAAAANRQLFNDKLAQMAGKIEDGFDKPQLIINNSYVSKKRGGRRARTRSLNGSGTGGTYSSPTYITNATLGPGNQLTSNLTVSSSVTIDGRDVSADGAALDAHTAATTGVHGITDTSDLLTTGNTKTVTAKTIVVSNNTITTAASGNLAATELNTALAELQTDIDTRATSAALTAHEADTSTHGVGTIVGTSEAQTLTTKTIVVANNTVTTASSGNLAATELNAALAELQTDIDTKAALEDFTDHLNDTSTHGVGEIVGTTESQTLTNKTISTADNTIESGAATSGQVLTADGAGAASWETPTGAPDQSYEISNLGLAASVGSSALTIALKDKSGSDPSGSSIVKIGFRNATLATGTYAQRTVTGALSVTVSSGSTLGHSSGNAHWIYVYAIDNAGTVELAVSSVLFDEGTTHSTTAEGGAGAADSNRVLYSTTARANVAIRLIGRMKSTQATAGTWASTMTEISLMPFRLPTISAIYTSNTADSFANGSEERLDFEDKEYDPYNTVTGTGTGGAGSWAFTAPAARLYSVKAYVQLATSSSWDLTERIILRMYVDGVFKCQLDRWFAPANINNEACVHGTRDIYLTAGQTIYFTLEQDSDGALALNGSATTNYMCITEAGF